MTWLVTGGAGYIGSHVVHALLDAGIDPVVIDDLSSGVESFVPERVPFVRGTLLDGDLVEQTLRDHDVEGVIHLAGFKYAGVSVQRPLHTYAAEHHRHGHPARGDGARRASTRSSSPPAPPPTARPTSTWSPRTPRPAPSRRTARPSSSASGCSATPPALRTCATPRCATSTSSARARPTSSTPARTTSSRSSSTCSTGARRRGSTATTTRPPTAPACATTSTSATSRWPTSRRPGRWPTAALARAGLQPRQRRGRLGAADHGRHPRGHRRSTSSPRSASAGPATPPGSSRTATCAARDLGWADAALAARHGRERLAGPQGRRRRLPRLTAHRPRSGSGTGRGTSTGPVSSLSTTTSSSPTSTSSPPLLPLSPAAPTPAARAATRRGRQCSAGADGPVSGARTARRCSTAPCPVPPRHAGPGARCRPPASVFAALTGEGRPGPHRAGPPWHRTSGQHRGGCCSTPTASPAPGPRHRTAPRGRPSPRPSPRPPLRPPRSPPPAAATARGHRGGGREPLASAPHGA